MDPCSCLVKRNFHYCFICFQCGMPHAKFLVKAPRVLTTNG